MVILFQIHEKCDNKGNTICFIKLENNFRIGGYTSKSWNYKINNFINDDNTFIFDLNNKKKYLPKNKKCIYSSKNGFSFGNFNIGVNENNFLIKILITSFDNNYYDVPGFNKIEPIEKIINIMLVGDSCVGKTSIIKKFLSFKNEYLFQTFWFENEKNITLNDGSKLSLRLYDTPRKERFLLNFFKNLNVIIMVYDITKKDSFESLNNYWYKEIKDYAKQNIILGIIGNKNDLFDYEVVNDEESQKFAKEINASFSLVSNKSYKEIEDFFNDICLKYINDIENYYITEIEVYKVNLIK